MTLSALVFGMLAPCSVDARSATDKEKAALVAFAADFEDATRQSQNERIISALPPRLLATIAGKAGATVAQLKEAMLNAKKNSSNAARIASFSMDVKNALHKELPNGEPYALIPTKTVIDAGNKGRFVDQSYSLCLMDKGRWFTLDVSDASKLALLSEAYPQFSDIEIPKGSIGAQKK